MNEIERLCDPLIAYIRENYNPHTEIVVRGDSIVVRQDIMGMPKEGQPDNVQPPQ